MRRRARLILPAAALAAATLVAAAPASAAPDPDVVYLFVATPGDGDVLSFGTAARTDASLTALPSAYPADAPDAIEVVDGTGYAIAPGDDGEELIRWAVETGATLSTTTMTLDEPSLPFVPNWVAIDVSWSGLDSADGVGLQTVACVWVAYSDSSEDFACFLGALDTTTAVFTPRIDVTAVRNRMGGLPTEIATDPLTGETRLFFVTWDNATASLTSWVAAVTDVGAGVEQRMDGLPAGLGAGEPLGADYDPDGTLWLSYGLQLNGQRLATYAPGADLTSATPTLVGQLPITSASSPYLPDYYAALAVTSWTIGTPPTTPAAELPDTGPAPVIGAGIAAGLLLLAGGLALLTRRRRV